MNQHMAASRQKSLSIGFAEGADCAAMGYGSGGSSRWSENLARQDQDSHQIAVSSRLINRAGRTLKLLTIILVLLAASLAGAADTNFYFQTVPRDMEPSILGIQWYRGDGLSNQFDVLVSAGIDMASSIKLRRIEFRMSDWDGDVGANYRFASAYRPLETDVSDLFYGKTMSSPETVTTNNTALNTRGIDLLSGETPVETSGLINNPKVYGTWWEMVGDTVSLGSSTNVAKLNMASVAVWLSDGSRYPNTAIKRLPTPSYELIWVPEPATCALFVAGLTFIAMLRRRKER